MESKTKRKSALLSLGLKSNVEGFAARSPGVRVGKHDQQFVSLSVYGAMPCLEMPGMLSEVHGSEKCWTLDCGILRCGALVETEWIL